MRDAKSASAAPPRARHSARPRDAAASLAAPLVRLGLALPPEHRLDEAQAFAPLLLAEAALPPAGGAPRLRERLLARVAASARAARAMHTQRIDDTPPHATHGVVTRDLYRAAPAAPARRPGEPERVRLIELAPHAHWHSRVDEMPALGHPSEREEWLVLRGDVRLGDIPLAPHDYHVRAGPCAAAATKLHAGAGGALLYQRVARCEADAANEAVQAATQRSAGAEWLDYAPGIRRRVLWRQGAEAAMLYHAQPGAAVPHHGHGHDEECLMLAGEFFLDEVLLRPLDYQLAPAGSEHRVSCTDTGVVIYAHGDLDLAVR